MTATTSMLASSAEEVAMASLESFSPDQLQMAEEALRSILMRKVQALAAEHGDPFLQSLLQKEIAKTKRMEADLAATKKKLGAQERVVDDLRAEVRKVKVQEEKSRFLCHNFQETAKKREQLTEKMQAEMAAYRTDVQERVNANVQTILSECEERRQRVDALEQEVKDLEESLAERKTAFEQSFTEFQDGLKGRSAQYEELIGAYQTSMKEVELLEARLMLVRRERNSVEMSRAALQQQLEVYQNQFDGFVNSVMKPEDVQALAQRQRDQANLRISELETEKSELQQRRAQADKDLTDLRAQLASLKRELPQLEKTRAAVEKRCRQAQQSLQTRK